jgi:DNA-binding transcriptional LysR family regulator
MDPNVSLKQLTIFTKVVYYGGISEAAQKMGLTPSAVSKSLQMLEEHLGVQLLQRTTRSIATTTAGEDLYGRLNEVLADLAFSLDTVKAYQRETSGEIRITCSMALGVTHLMQIISEYQKLYPDVQLSVSLSDKLENLNEGNYDIALRIVSTEPGSYATRKLAVIDWIYCASPLYLEKYGTPRSIQDLSAHKCLVYPGIHAAWTYVDADGKKSYLLNQHNIAVQVNCSLALVEAAFFAQGVAYLPNYLVNKHIANGDLIPLFKNHTPHYLYAVYVQNRYPNNVGTFIDFMYNWMNPSPPWETEDENAS